MNFQDFLKILIPTCAVKHMRKRALSHKEVIVSACSAGGKKKFFGVESVYAEARLSPRIEG